MKQLNLTILALLLSLASFGQAGVITGPLLYCPASTGTLVDTTTGGIWSSSNTSVATVGSLSGVVLGVMPGIDTITYTVGASFTSVSITVDALPVPITGPSTFCEGTSGTETTSPVGGSWTVSTTLIATIGSASGVVTALSMGNATITYTIAPACVVTKFITVNPVPSPIFGTTTVCVGGTTSLSDVTFGGTWSSNSTAIATVNTLGVATGVSVGSTIISYTIGTGCAAATTVSVSSASIPFYMLTGGGGYCAGGSGVAIGLAGSSTGISYQLYCSGIAVGSAIAGTGAALSCGLHTIAGTYTVVATNGGGCSSAMIGSVVVSINPLPAVFAVSGGGSYCAGGTGALVGLANSVSGINYQLYNGGAPVGTPMAGTGTALNFGYQTAAGTYSIVATNPTTLCTSTMSGSAIVSTSPLPAVFAVSGGGSYCAGGTGALVGLANSVSGINYQLYNGASPVGTPMAGTGTALSFGYQTAAGTYSIVATNPTTLCTSTMSGSAIVAISLLPNAYTVTGGGSYCSGGTGVHIGLSSSDPGVSYQLYVGVTAVGSPVAGSGTALDFGLQTTGGIYSVVATNIATTCSSDMTGTVTITITPTVAPAVSITPTPGLSVCAGTAVTYMATPTSGGTLPVYQWAVNGTTISGATSAAYSYTPATGDVVGVSMTSSAACASPATVSATATMVVTAVVTPVVSITPSPGLSVCAGTAVTYTATPTSGGALPVYQWAVNGTTISGATSTAYSYTPATGDVVGVSMTSSAACASPATVSATATMVVTAPVTPAVSITPTPGLSVCAGTAVTYTAAPTSGGTLPVYQWAVNGTTISGATSAAYSYTPATGDVVGVSMTSSAACASPATVSATATMVVTAVVTPSVVITPSPGLTVCSGASVSFTSAVTGGGGLPTYAWSVNGTAITGATTASYTYIPVTGDVVGVTITSSAPCVLVSTASTSVTMTIDVPTVTASVASAGCGPTMVVTASGATGYSWSPATGLSCSTCSSASLVPASTTIYTVTGTDGYGCTGTGTVTVDGNRISGYITYTGTPATDTFKVWLIQFNPSDSSITALDSTTNCVYPGTPYYQFIDEPAGNYMVKAKLNSAVPGTSGYMPTYSLSASHWDSAATVSHSGAADTMHINMIYGIVPSGPGFISGYVVSGAGRNTAGEVPAAGMNIYLKDAMGNLLTYTTTATDGTYSFSNLAYGTYLIYPESYKDYTTPSAIITLVAGSDSVMAVNFKQHTTLGTITPYDNSQVKPVISNNLVTLYPNPTTGMLNFTIGNGATGNATVAITDVTGREVMKSDMQIATGAINAIDISNIKDGIYFISIKTDKTVYSGKVVKQQ